jgi:molybdate transport system permease protein
MAIGSVWIVAFLTLPLFGLLSRASLTGGLLEAMGRPVVLEALRLSAITSLAALVLSVTFGTPLALLLARRQFRGHRILDTLVDLPMVLPPTVAGLALLLTLGRRGLLGGTLSLFGISLPFTLAAVIVAQVFVSAPFYIRAARAGFETVPKDVEDAAAIDGAGGLTLLRAITMPLAAPAVVGGMIMTWARALGEFGATVMFAGNFEGRTQTMTLAVYSALESDLDAAIGLSIILLGISFTVLLLFRVLLGERLSGMLRL